MEATKCKVCGSKHWGPCYVPERKAPARLAIEPRKVGKMARAKVIEGKAVAQKPVAAKSKPKAEKPKARKAS